MKAHPALFEGEGRGREGQTKLRNTFQMLWPEEFSSGDFGLRSFRRRYRRFRPGPESPISPAENSAFSREEWERGGKGKGRGVIGFKYCLAKKKWRSSRGTCAVYVISKSLPGRSQLRSAAAGQLVVPFSKTKTLGNKGFVISAPSTWNSLSSELHDQTMSLFSFKKHLKTFLFQTQ